MIRSRYILLAITIPIIVLRVIDGDTFDAQDACGLKFRVRTADYDAFETRQDSNLIKQALASGITTIEAQARGEICKKILREILSSQSNKIEMEQVGTDIYGRVVARVFVNGATLKSLIPDSLASKKVYIPRKKK